MAGDSRAWRHHAYASAPAPAPEVIDEAAGVHPQQGESTLRLVRYSGGRVGMQLTVGGATHELERSEAVARETMAKFRAACGLA